MLRMQLHRSREQDCSPWGLVDGHFQISMRAANYRAVRFGTESESRRMA